MRKLDAELDVVVSGLVFQDLVLGLPAPPRPGTEVWATESQESPGGIANFAVALARLGLRTGLAAAFAADPEGDRVWDRLTDEGIDLTLSRKLAGWQTPLTVALAYDNDRALVTRGTPPPLSADELITAPPAAFAFASHSFGQGPMWAATARASGGAVISSSADSRGGVPRVTRALSLS
jgi:sugar/nucleoside kinase (ribokinase family)